MAIDQIPNQIFIGCPWHTIRHKYEVAINRLNHKYPLSFVIIGRSPEQDAIDLLKIIKEKLLRSSTAIFDATAGNPNVSLEFGLAEASEIPRILYISRHGATKQEKKQIADVLFRDTL